MAKTAFVTGASAGIGEETVKGLLAAGYTVYAGARRDRQDAASRRRQARVCCRWT